jgi:mannosyltransferase OCH1-like enzyme
VQNRKNGDKEIYMIPKKIHYCWFGGNPKSEIIEQCIASWKEYCPDYEIIEWNESNFDVNCTPYTAAAYEAKKWAFVSDYARLKVVYDNGGIYLDTDVLLHNRLDELLMHECWLAQEDIRYVSTGLGFGAQKGHPLIRAMMATYENCVFSYTPNTEIDAEAVEQYLSNWEKKETSQSVNDVFILGLKDYSRYARHLATISWQNSEACMRRQKEIEDILTNRSSGNKRKKIVYQIKRKLHSPKIIAYFEARKGTRLEKIYLFLTYDLLDYGIIHYVKRMFSKLFS